jgi:hypothetical protein
LSLFTKINYIIRKFTKKYDIYASSGNSQAGFELEELEVGRIVAIL